MRENITRLPDAGREEQLERWGLDKSAHWSETKRWGHGPDDAVVSPGEAEWDDPDVAAREIEERGFLVDGGWGIATVTEGGGRDGGMTSHRGILHPDEYVDHEALVGRVEDELGFTFDDVHAVYRQGRLSDDQRELRGRIDARLLALSRSGANMALLGRILGFKTTGDTMHRALKNALARARAAEGVSA